MVYFSGILSIYSKLFGSIVWIIFSNCEMTSKSTPNGTRKKLFPHAIVIWNITKNLSKLQGRQHTNGHLKYFLNEIWVLWFWDNHKVQLDKTNKMACAPREDSDQNLRCPHEETFGLEFPIERTAKTLIRLGGCPGWSESSLGEQVILLVLSCCGSYYVHVHDD